MLILDGGLLAGIASVIASLSALIWSLRRRR
jgi:hypothetical protein